MSISLTKGLIFRNLSECKPEMENSPSVKLYITYIQLFGKLFPIFQPKITLTTWFDLYVTLRWPRMTPNNLEMQNLRSQLLETVRMIYICHFFTKFNEIAYSGQLWSLFWPKPVDWWLFKWHTTNIWIQRKEAVRMILILDLGRKKRNLSEPSKM